MEGKTTCIYYKDLTQSEKNFVNELERDKMRKRREEFINNPLYKDLDPEDIWYLRKGFIANWTFGDNYLFTKCECGSLKFECLGDTLADDELSRKCEYRCDRCGKTHIEYN